jgi:hypothetical protein
MAGYCRSYCSHGGRCTLSPGHETGHDSGYCQWTDAEGLTREQADIVLASAEGGRDYLETGGLFESLLDGLED